ncbi:MAG: SusD/RagB family nutrient-binding outer membrane lipoprotein, partial [Chitinophagales bacterium]|nr:SusD/RagB family nutrient-binding outer membrane lipoprotein [Chitinophagales bacterium]
MKKIIYSVALLAVVMLAGCSKNFEDMNTNPKQPTDVPSAYLLTSAQKNLTDILTSSNVNSNVFRLWTQHWT